VADDLGAVGNPILIDKNEVLFEMREVFEGGVRAGQKVKVGALETREGNKAINPARVVGNDQGGAFCRNRRFAMESNPQGEALQSQLGHANNIRARQVGIQFNQEFGEVEEGRFEQKAHQAVLQAAGHKAEGCEQVFLHQLRIILRWRFYRDGGCVGCRYSTGRGRHGLSILAQELVCLFKHAK